MKGELCPICTEIDPDDHHFNDYSHLYEIIQKHLHIQIQNEYLKNICKKCKQTIIDWNEFAQKCWANRKKFEDYLKSSTNVKNEYFEIKIENSTDDFLNDDFDDRSSIYQEEPKQDDPLCDSDIKNTANREIEITIVPKQVKREPSTSVQRKRRKGDNNVSEKIKKECVESENTDPSKENLKNEKKKKKTNKHVEYNCHVCFATMKNWTSLSRHCSKEHSTKAKVLCAVCGKYLEALSSIRQHRKLHNESTGYKCTECDKKFPYKRNLKEHMLIHFPDKEFNHSCPHCGKTFFFENKFKKHLYIHLPRGVKDMAHCDICGKKFTSKFNLKKHILAIHEKIKDHICEVCGAGFSTKGNLEGHKVTHLEENKFECKKCPKTFKCKNALKRHQVSHAEGGIPCPICPMVLKNVRTLRKHKLVHMDEYKHSCPACEKKFKRRSNMKAHMKMHEGLKPYVCDLCSNPYGTRQNLILHLQRAHLIV